MPTARYLPDAWTLPELTEENREFFTTAELRIQRCLACGTVQHPPTDVCHQCRSFEFDHVVARGTGIVESFSFVHHPVHPMLKAAVPYNVVVVALDDYPGVRIVGNVIDVVPIDLEIGLPVAATWAEIPTADDRRETMYLPQWTVVRPP
jgi:uncharacterized OB-fold protein